MLQERLKALCSRYRLPVPQADERGKFHLAFGDAPVLRIGSVPGGVLLECEVASFSGAVSIAERERLCRIALRASLSRTMREWQSTPMPCIAATGSELYLQMRLYEKYGAWGNPEQERSPLHDQSLFEDMTERFLNFAETWRGLLEKEVEPVVKVPDRLARFEGLWP